MQDLLSDINAAAPGQQGQQQQGGTSDEKDDVLASLERELAGLTAGGAPPGLGGGGGPPGLTAASLVVSHTADRARQFDPSQPAGPNPGKILLANFTLEGRCVATADQEPTD